MKILILCVAMLFSTITFAQDASITWQAPIERADNTPLIDTDIASFRIYYGTVSGEYQNVANVMDGTATSHIITNFVDGTYYFVMTTTDTEGRESVYSSEIAVTFTGGTPIEIAPPKTVQSFTISQILSK